MPKISKNSSRLVDSSIPNGALASDILSQEASQNKNNLQMMSVASHELRQPLQSIFLLKEIMSEAIDGCSSRHLLKRLNDTASLMFDTLDALRDYQDLNNNCDYTTQTVSINSILENITFKIKSKGGDQKVKCRILPTSLNIDTCPELLEKGIYYLIMQLVRFSSAKRLVVGCRRQSENIKVEIWWLDGDVVKEGYIATSSNENKKNSIKNKTNNSVGVSLLVAEQIFSNLGFKVHYTRRYGFSSLIEIIIPAVKQNGISNDPVSMPINTIFENKDNVPLVVADDDTFPYPKIIYLVDDDQNIRVNTKEYLEIYGFKVECFNTAAELLDRNDFSKEGLIIIDYMLPDISGIEVIQNLRNRKIDLPFIMITGYRDIKAGIEALRLGAVNIFEKPFNPDEMLSSIKGRNVGYCNSVNNGSRFQNLQKNISDSKKIIECIASLTVREKQILQLVVDGHPSKIIAGDLGVSQRTVENHRASIMRKTGTKTIASLVKLVVSEGHY